MPDTQMEVAGPGARVPLFLKQLTNGLFALAVHMENMVFNGQPLSGTNRLPVEQLALSQAVDFVGIAPDTAAVSSTIISTHATPGTDTSISIPDTARGFIIEPTGNLVRWNVGIAALAVGAGTTLGRGGRAKADVETTRLLLMLDGDGDPIIGRTLYLRSTVASVSCYVEFFG